MGEDANQQEPKQPEGYDRWSPSRVLSQGLAYTTFIGGLLYSAGYIYWLTFFSVFHVDIESLDPPSSKIWLGNLIVIARLLILVGPAGAIPRSGSIALYFSVMVPIAILLLSLIVPFLVRRSKNRNGFRESPRRGFIEASGKWQKFALLVTTYALIGPFLIGLELAQQQLSQPATKVTLFFKQGEQGLFGSELRDANRTGRLALLVQTKDIVIVYQAHHPVAHVIPRSNLQAVRVESYPGALNSYWFP